MTQKRPSHTSVNTTSKMDYLTVDSEPSCDIIGLRMDIKHLTNWDCAVQDVSQRLGECIQKTFNYLFHIPPGPISPIPVKDKKSGVHNFKWILSAEVTLHNACISVALLS